MNNHGFIQPPFGNNTGGGTMSMDHGGAKLAQEVDQMSKLVEAVPDQCTRIKPAAQGAFGSCIPLLLPGAGEPLANCCQGMKMGGIIRALTGSDTQIEECACAAGDIVQYLVDKPDILNGINKLTAACDPSAQDIPASYLRVYLAAKVADNCPRFKS